MKLNLLNDMARICRLLSLLLLLAVGLAGCKTSRHSSSLSGESACLSSKVQLTVPHKDATLTVNGTMKLKKEECMQISFLMPILRTEVARMEVTPDEILLVDRMGKRYVRATRKELGCAAQEGGFCPFGETALCCFQTQWQEGAYRQGTRDTLSGKGKD